MGLIKLDPEKLYLEAKINEEINNCIETNSDFVFKAGAGAGKTYSLISTLKNLLISKGKLLENTNKKIICITYTNAATDEIRKRLGDSDVVQVSTIHERMWDIIRLQQSALLIIHQIKVKSEIVDIQQKMNDESDTYGGFTALTSEQQSDFVNYMLEHREDFYRLKRGAAGPFKDRFKDAVAEFSYTLSNKTKFERVVSKAIKKRQLANCLTSINEGEVRFKKVRYDANYNSDQLHNMLISHDTLLEYTRQLVEQYPLFREIVVDAYPYIFIDEYQDTSDNIINITSLLSAHAKEKNKNFLVGYFGDAMQSIYDTGVGATLSDIHTELAVVTKKYNRRSHSEIVDIANNFRNDEVKQESIFTDCEGGSFSFYITRYSFINDPQYLVGKFVAEFKALYQLADTDVVDCLVLTNATVSKLGEFNDIYDTLSGFFFYTDVAQKIISTDLDKLDDGVRTLHRVIDIYLLIQNLVQFKLIDILPTTSREDLTLQASKDYIRELQSAFLPVTNEHSLCVLFQAIFDIYNSDSVSETFKTRINEIFPEKLLKYSVQGAQDWINDKLPSLGSLKDEERPDNIEQLFNIPLRQYINWHAHLTGSKDKKTRFHTFHSSKGLEYKNVIIFMQSNFSRDNQYFPKFFKEPDSNESQKKRNLLYVACSRAIDNLAVVYADDISTFEPEITNFFGRHTEFT